MKIRKDIKFPAIIGTGCARSGTNFLANLMTQGGVIMGHETIFGAPGFGEWREGMIGDVSWLAAPFLQREKKRGAIIIQIIRHPLKQISSLCHQKVFEDYNFKSNIYSMYKELYMPHIRRLSLMDRYIYNWLSWNRLIEGYADLIYRLEDLVENPYELFEDLGIDVKGKVFDTKKTNDYKNVKQLDWSDFKDCMYYKELLKGAVRYKYITTKKEKELAK
jgi:hypothetical protein